MTNYKKSLLSVAAAFAIATTATTASYIPLTSTSNDNQWVLFGVSGFLGVGEETAATGADGEFSIADSAVDYIIKDDNGDADVAVSGFHVLGGDEGDLAKIKSRTDDVVVEVRLNTLNINYYYDDPVRTIYVSSVSGGSPDFSFEYKLPLEGKTLEYSIDGGAVKEIVINSDNTYDNPAVGTDTTAGSSETVAGTEMSDFSGDNSLVDYDFADNPVIYTQYQPADHFTPNPVGRTRFHSYDAKNGVWLTYDSDNAAGTNNFEKFEKAKAYWGKIDTNTSVASASDTDKEEAGVVLRSQALTAADYTAASIAEGWNLLAFDSSNSVIKHASTGMLITLAPMAQDDNITIIDSSGNHELDITFTTGDFETTSAISKHINYEITRNKAIGLLPATFDLKAFPAYATVDKLALISNKRFTVKNKDGAPFTSATTLSGEKLWDMTTLADSTAGSFPADGLRTKYGEYSMIVNPLTGSETASTLALKATLNVGVFDSDTGAYSAEEEVLIESTNTAAAAQFQAVTDITATEINLDINGTMGEVLLSSASPFYVKEQTFSRAYKYIDSDTDGTIKITGAGATIGDQTIKAATLDTAAEIAADINGEISAGSPSDETNNIIFVVDNEGGNELFIAETVGQHLTYVKSSSDMAKGSVKGVYSLGSLAKKGVKTVIDINITEVPDDMNNTVRFNYVTLFDDNISGTEFVANKDSDLDGIVDWNADESDADENRYLLDKYVAQIKADFATAGITATVSHNYDTNVSGAGNAAADLNASLITITGEDVIDVYTYITQDVNSTETFTVTFNTPAIDTNNTMVFDNTYIDFNATGNDYNSTVKFHSYFKLIYDLNTTSNWEVNSTDSNATLDFYARNQAAVTGTVATGSFVYTDTNNDDTTVPVAVVSDYVEGHTLSTPEATISVSTPDSGYLANRTPDLTDDLKFNTIYAPNYVMDGPLYVLREAGYKLEALVTGTRDLANTDIIWDSIDLTRAPTEWLSSQEYNLFDTDDEAGYWAKLVEDSSDNPIGIVAGPFNPNYTHHFDQVTVDGSMTYPTYNYISGNLNVTVTGIYDNDNEATAARVTATINGVRTELLRDNTSTTYTGKVSYYETSGIRMNTAHEVVINVSDGLGNNKTEILAIDFDNKKPATPTITPNGIGLTIGDTYGDETVAFYAFDGTIPEDDTESSAIDTTDLCKNSNPVTAASPVGNILVIAVDGGGTLATGNASDAAATPYMPITKSRSLIVDSTVDNSAVSDYAAYNADCVTTGIIDVSAEESTTLKTGISLDVKDAGISKIAFTSLGLETATGSPVTAYIKENGIGIAVTYPDAYVGKDLFISFAGVVYSYTFPTAANADSSSTSDYITGDGTVLTGITF